MSQPKGIDVSVYQGRVNWRLVKEAGISFAFIKASEGATLVDSRLVENRRNTRANGILCGYYHFFRPRANLQGQIDNFVNALGSLYPGDLPPVIDLEVPDQWQEFSVGERNRMVQSWVQAVKAKLGTDPIIYCSSYFPDDVLGNAQWLANYPLWLAQYTAAPTPRVPAPWEFWTFWQHSDTGRVDGVQGDVDVNRFNGSFEQLAKFKRPGQFPTPSLMDRVRTILG